jgi:hypothetical protein
MTDKGFYSARMENISFTISATVLGYFLLFQGFLAPLRNKYVIIGVLIELLTIPMLMAAVASFFLSAILWYKKRFRLTTKPFYSLLFLSALAGLFMLV